MLMLEASGLTDLPTPFLSLRDRVFFSLATNLVPGHFMRIPELGADKQVGLNRPREALGKVSPAKMPKIGLKYAIFSP